MLTDTLPETDTLVQNILATYELATDTEIADGIEWYENANLLAAQLATDNSLTLRQTSAIIAALSPQTSWVLNQILATDLCEGNNIAALPLSVRKATDILNGQDPDTVLAPPNPKVPTGKKVRAFFDNILRPYTSTAVTVDRHAIAIAYGYQPPEKVLQRKGYYEAVEHAYRLAAQTLNLRPCEIQAITWVTHRRLKGIVDHKTELETF